MRRTIVISALAFVVVAAAAAETVRSPGAYVSLTTADAALCARACADDTICMAWSFQRQNRCELSAVVPAALDANALAAGFAARAPMFLQPQTPVVQAEAAIEAAPAPEVAEVGEQTPPPEDDGLLGGPEEGDLRLGLR